MFLLYQSTHRMLVKYHPVIGHLYVPNLRARLPNDTGGYFVVTNSLGFRSDLEFPNAKSGVPRILMFGDSYTAGDNCANADRYSDQLARMLGAEVYNFGLSGSGLDQQLLIFREFAHRMERDLIVLCVQVDSMRRIQARYRESVDRITRRRLLVPKPYFTLENGELILHNVPVPRERPEAGSTPHTPGHNGGGWSAAALRKYRENPHLEPVRQWVRQDLKRLKSEAFRVTGIQPYPEFKSADSEGWKLMRALLEAFIREVAPTPVMIVPIPTYEFYLHGVKPIYQELFNTLENREQGVHVFDLSHPLISEPWEVRQKYSFQTGGHFTPFAHEKAAGLMREAIVERGLLPQKETSLPRTPRAGTASSDSINILGISCFYHNSAACLVRDGRIVAAAEEERFTRLKNDRRFPHQAVNFCLEQGGINQQDLAAVVYYDNAALTFERILHSMLSMGELAEDSWLRNLPAWIRYKLHLPPLIRKYLQYDGLILQEMHHRSHAASAFFPSPYDRAAILTIDGVGEWATASIGYGRGSRIELLQEMHFPHSLGLLYSAFTHFTGFKVNSGEYKMMGLAPYGEPKYVNQILDKLVDLKEDGSVELNLEYFGFLHQPAMTNERFAELFGGPARKPDSRITRREMDLARSVQVVTEESMLRMARHVREVSDEKKLCLAGGVALNCVANGRVLREGPFEDIWIQPAAGDAGCALGAALDAYHTYFGKERKWNPEQRPLQGGSYWGPEFSDTEILSYLDSHGYPYRRMDDAERAAYLAEKLAEGKVVGHFAGRLEYGPRSLGARSILGDARNQDMQAELNLKIKFRESFRPFAPTVLAEKVQDYFELDRESPYMLLVAPVRQERRKPLGNMEGEDLLPIVRQPRSDIPAVTHVDYSARIQTIAREDHPVYYDLIRRFEQLTGCGVIVNTSFNVRGEPIVCTPGDAYRCFMRTGMNVLALGNYVLLKENQPPWPEGAAEGLESEDAGKNEPNLTPDRLLRDLKKLFVREFLPLSKSLDRKDILVGLEFRKTRSQWISVPEQPAPKDIFEFPPALSAGELNPDKYVDSLVCCWRPGPARNALQPLLRSLVELGLRYPANETVEEEVSESVYVMF